MTDVERTPCPGYETLLALAHGELSTVEALEAQNHLRHCSACAEEVAWMKTLTGEMSQLAEAVEPPATLRGRVLSRLRFREGRRRWSIFDAVRVAALVGAGAVALVVVGAQLPLEKPHMVLHVSPAQDRLRSAESPTASAQFSHGHVKGRQASAGVEAPAAPAGSGGGYPGFATPQRDGRTFDAIKNTSTDYDEVHKGETRIGPLDPIKIAVPIGGASLDDVHRYARGKALEDTRRKVVHNLNLGVRVNRPLEGLQDEVSARIRKEGGYVESANLEAPAEGERTAEMSLRVPVERFDAVTQWLSGLGEVKSKSASGEDVTGTWVDQRAELREFRAAETRLQAELDHAKNAAAREVVRERLLNLRVRIRRSEERFALTTKLAALATIHLSLTEEPQARVRGSLLPDMDNTFRSAVAAFMIAVRVPLGLLIWLLVFAPLWLPCVLVYRWATRMARRREPEAAVVAGE